LPPLAEPEQVGLQLQATLLELVELTVVGTLTKRPGRAITERLRAALEDHVGSEHRVLVEDRSPSLRRITGLLLEGPRRLPGNKDACIVERQRRKTSGEVDLCCIAAAPDITFNHDGSMSSSVRGLIISRVRRWLSRKLETASAAGRVLLSAAG
jgi:hypothetical protein